MKTVIDAVNEFEGDYNCKDVSDTCDQIIVAMKNFHGYSVGDIEVGSGNRYDEKGSWRAICTFNEFLATVAECETNFGKCNQSYSDYKFDYHLPPESTPTYTQEMADNGVLPSVGMECQTSTGVVTIAYKGNKLLIAIDDEGTEFQLSNKGALHALKPLTLPIALIDGKAYQFYYDGDTFQGIYSAQGDDFHSDKFVSSVNICTNIQLLTVEVK